MEDCSVDFCTDPLDLEVHTPSPTTIEYTSDVYIPSPPTILYTVDANIQNPPRTRPGQVYIQSPTNVQYTTEGYIQSPPEIGPTSWRVICPSCRLDVMTSLKYEPSTSTHVMAVFLCVFLCWPCVCLPYCMDSCQNANHYCPNCNAFIGTYQS